ncbi:MAG: lipoate--protein ligase [Clostridiales bacterium]|nr:lipoate--protein ligase [Clostridiales bacterium]
MITSTRVLITDCRDPHRNLALEEALLRALPAGQAALYLWQNAHTVVIGAGQNAWRECHTDLLRREGGHLARRSSGGGAVYHDLGNLNFTFLAPRADYDVARQLDVVRRAVGALGLRAERSGRNDLTIGGRKFSGNAFRLSRDAALHHGTLLVSSDMEMVARYLNVSPDKLKAKGVESVPSRVMNLNTMADIDVEQMAGAMIDAFWAEYGRGPVSPVGEAEFADLPGLIERYQSWDWVYGSSPQGDVQLERRFPWGGVQLIADVKGGRLQSLRAFTDSMDESLAARLESALNGLPWRGDALSAAARSIGQDDVADWLAEV